jgi:hypothetical protein
MDVKRISIRCRCGALLEVRSVHAGKRATCPRCAEGIQIPRNEISAQDDHADTRIATAPGRSTIGALRTPMCSICQNAIEPGEELCTCRACQLPFHGECWKENRGCSAYGCPEVGKPVLIEVNPNDLEERATPGSVPPPRQSPLPSPPFPTEHLLLAASVMSFLVGLITFGAPCLACLSVGFLVSYLKWVTTQHVWILAIAGAICLGGLVIGIYGSCALWRG